jgi:ABC-type amino acid transport substrate-binding protein
MGLQLKYSLYPWDELIPALQKGEVDIVISGMAITPRRALKVKFSQPYADNGVGMAANSKLTKNIKSIKAMRAPEINIGVVKGTISENVGRKAFRGATFTSFDAEEPAEEALLKGQLHALVLSNPGPKFMVLKYPDKLDQPLASPLLELREAFAVNQAHSDFLDYLNSWIYARAADGTLDTIRQYWFESLSWQDQLQ